MSNYKGYTKNIKAAKSNTPQTSPLVGREKEMAKNNAGGYSFVITDMSRLDRFLILGTESNTYYVSGQKLTEDNAKAIIALIQSNGTAVVERTAQISESGRAPKNDPALFVLALAMTYGDENTKRAAYEALPRIARIGTHILHLAEFVNGMRGWGRGIRGAFGNWYLNQTPKGLAMNLVKYANRDGWTHRDILRLAHPSGEGVYQSLLAYAADKPADFSNTDIEGFMSAVAEVKKADEKRAIKLIEQYKLPREVLPTELLNSAKVWESMLPHMGMTALVRNLATMTRLGVLAPLNGNTKLVAAKLTDMEQLTKAKVHPIQMLSALRTYDAGRGFRGTNTWTPVQQILSALEDGFYKSFGAIPATGKNFYLGIDVSGSMTYGDIAGVPNLTPNVAAAVMAMVTARTEKNYHIAGFTSVMKNLGITSNDTIASATKKTQDNSFGGTDCAVAIRDAMNKKMHVDAFVIYTDNDTWAGYSHPVQELKKYRDKTGINAKVIVVGMTATGFTIADPKDKGMLDVVGFDSATPTIISDFASGKM